MFYHSGRVLPDLLAGAVRFHGYAAREKSATAGGNLNGRGLMAWVNGVDPSSGGVSLKLRAATLKV